jgi:hypothetical protein
MSDAIHMKSEPQRLSTLELFAGSGTDPCNGRCRCCRVTARGPLQFSPAFRHPRELEGRHKATPMAQGGGGLPCLRRKTIEHLGSSCV